MNFGSYFLSGVSMAGWLVGALLVVAIALPLLSVIVAAIGFIFGREKEEKDERDELP